MPTINYLAILKWLVPIALVVGLLAFVYEKGHEAGAHSRDKEVAGLQAEAKKWHDGYDAQVATLNNEREAHDKALKQLQTDQATVVASLKGQLDEAQKKQVQYRVVIQHDIERITPAIDAAYPLPNAFVRLHDDAALQDGTTQGPSLADSGRPDDAAASGVAASAAARVIAANYGECTARGEVIKAWQDWYTKNRTAWEAAVKAQADFTVVQPAPTH